jgi:hypothetical protein
VGSPALAPARSRAQTVLGALVCLAAGLVCVGSWAPWFTISLATVSANIGGLNSHLDGRYSLALGVVGLGLGVTVLRVGRRVVVHRVVAGALAILGAGGVAMVWHQYVHLVHSATKVGRTSGLTPFAKYFDVHAGAAWGLWLTGGAFAALALTAFALPFAAGRADAPMTPTAPGEIDLAAK